MGLCLGRRSFGAGRLPYFFRKPRTLYEGLCIESASGVSLQKAPKLRLSRTSDAALLAFAMGFPSLNSIPAVLRGFHGIFAVA